MVELYTHFIIRWRYVVVLLTLATVMVIGYGAQKLSFSNDYRMFFGTDNPQLLAFEKMQNTFNKNDNILFVLTPEDGEHPFARSHLSHVLLTLQYRDHHVPAHAA